MSSSVYRCLLAHAIALAASLLTAKTAQGQCPQIPVPGPGPSARFLYDPIGAPTATCVYSVLVTPHSGVGPDVGPNSTGNKAIFTVKNTGSGGSTDTYNITCGATGNVTCSSVKPTIIQLVNGASATDTLFYSAGAPGSGTTGTVKLVAHGSQGASTAADSGTYSITVGVPIVALAGLRYDDQDLARCAASCFQFGYSQSTAPYFSLGAGRAVTLVYRGEHNLTQPFIHVDVNPPPGGTAPSKWWLQATRNGARVTFVNGDTILKFTSGSNQVRLGGQLPRIVGLPTEVDSLNITVTAEFTGGVTIQAPVIRTKMAIIEDLYSPIGQGWTLGGIQRAHIQTDGSALVTDGSGSAFYFAANASPPIWFGSPPGELSYFHPEYTGPTLTAYTRRYPDSTQVWFDVNGYMTKAIDAFGNTTQIKYDGSNRVDSIIDPMNRVIVLAYDANGFLHTITDPGGRVTTVTVQANALLTQITDPDTKSTTFGWTNSQLTSITDRRGKITTIYYNASAQPDSTAAPAVPIYGSGSIRPTIRFKPWQLAGVPYAPTGVTPFTPPLTSTVEARITEPGSAINHLTVDRWGQPLSVTNTAGDVATFAYDALGQLVNRTLPYYGSAVSDSAVSDTFGFGIFKRIAGTPGIKIRHGPYGQADSIWPAVTADSVPTVRPYIGSNGRVDSVAIAKVVRQRTRYDSRGRVDSLFDGRKQFVAHYHYDATTGNIDTVYAPGGVRAAIAYDNLGRPSAITSPGFTTQALYYDALNRLDSAQTSDGVATRKVKYGYDELFLRSVSDPKGQVDSLFYNDIGWVVTEKDPAGGTLQSAYSIDGDLKQWTNRRAQAIAYAYDTLHRLIQKTGANTDSVTWSYGAAASRLIAIKSPVSTDSIYLSVLGEPDSVRTVIGGQTFLRRYLYRKTGQLVSDSVSGGTITTWQRRQYVYDSATAVLATMKIGGRTTTTRADSNMDVRALTLPGGEVDTNTLGSLRVPLDFKTSAPYAGTTDRLLSLDAGYRIQQQFKNVTPASGRFFAYDSLGELTSGSDKHWNTALPGNCLNTVFGYNCQASGAGWTTDNSTSYSYDSAGNRISQGGAYGTANRITSFNGCTYSTDADGNVTGRTCPGTPSLTATFSWSAESQLRSVTNQGTTYNLKYDAEGHLVRIDLGATPQSHFLWDGDNVLAELDGAATTKRAEYSFYPGMDELHALIQGTTLYFAHEDLLGDVLALTDSTKTVQRTYSYDDWGLSIGGTDTHGFSGVDRTRWKGALQMSLGGGDLYYMRNRWYEPQTGRFLSEDPVGQIGGINLYQYSTGDPVNGSDPTGLCNVVDECTRDFRANGCFWEQGLHDVNNDFFFRSVADQVDWENFGILYGGKEFLCGPLDGLEDVGLGPFVGGGGGGRKAPSTTQMPQYKFFIAGGDGALKGCPQPYLRGKRIAVEFRAKTHVGTAGSVDITRAFYKVYQTRSIFSGLILGKNHKRYEGRVLISDLGYFTIYGAVNCDNGAAEFHNTSFPMANDPLTP